jgi:hypothetical protein
LGLRPPRERGAEMANISGEILINRPVEQVFDFVADQRNEPIYNPRMLRSEKITEGPIGGRDAIPRDGNIRTATSRDAHRGH